MQYASFLIRNFKGIQKLEFDISQSPSSPIYLLVGLNESGKTTILEALSFFQDHLSGEKELSLLPNVVSDIHDLIPKSKKDNFNESIVIEANIKFEKSDKTSLEGFFLRHNTKFESLSETLRICSYFDFKDSKFIKQRNVWVFDIKLKQGRQRVSRELQDTHPLWGDSWKFMSKLIPPLIYYPNFLFNFPDKIYLEKTPGESKEQDFYRQVLQDILDSVKNNLNLKTHIVDRAKSDKSQDLDACESVINKMKGQITRLVLDDKFSIFKEGRKNKEIIISLPKMDPQKKIYYVELKLKDGQESYYIRERSLGFRWYFTFLLFTQFRIARLSTANNIYFLFDEPASNLHQSAQSRLLNALKHLIEHSHASVIYTTHSHHMINSTWLENTFVVRNIALDYEKDDEYSSSMTNIKIDRYRTFVSQNPASTTYFQPILDVLGYRPSNLENIPNLVLLEGKNDFYLLSYFNEVIFSKKSSLNLCPGCGAGTLSEVIRIYYAWGKNFVILLDADTEGTKQKKRYNDVFGKIVEAKIYCLSNINPKWTDKGMEKLIFDKDKLILQQSVFPSTDTYDKKMFNLAIQELLVTNKKVQLSPETESNITQIFNFLREKCNT